MPAHFRSEADEPNHGRGVYVGSRFHATPSDWPLRRPTALFAASEKIVLVLIAS
jgi:hypothetical protein